MIEGNEYVETVELYFDFLITEFGFKKTEKVIKDNVYYDIQYHDKTRNVSISYENIEDYLQVIISMLQHGKLPHFDDKTKTLHLNHLNAQILPELGNEEIIQNSQYFLEFDAKSELERKLLKSAKELRLCLKHFELIK